MAQFKEIQGLFEPSGVVQLNDGRLLVVEDEPVNPFKILSNAPNSTSFSVTDLQTDKLFLPTIGRVNDLEGVTKDLNGAVYAITSHSRNKKGKRDSKREMFIQFTLAENGSTKFKVRGDLRKKLVKAFPVLQKSAKERDVKQEQGLNLEGLTFSPDGNVLWIGLRAPLIEEKAILVGLLNPRGAIEFSEPFEFINAHVAIDLDGGGIRDIAYVPELSGYLILSQRENTKKEKAFKLWLWSGDAKSAPRRARIANIKKLHRTEGIAPVRLNGKEQLILVSDDGNRTKGKSAHYLLIDYTRINIETDH